MTKSVCVCEDWLLLKFEINFMAGQADPGETNPFGNGDYEMGGGSGRKIVPPGETIGSAAAHLGYPEVDGLRLQDDEAGVVSDYEYKIDPDSGLMKVTSIEQLDKKLGAVERVIGEYNTRREAALKRFPELAESLTDLEDRAAKAWNVFFESDSTEYDLQNLTTATDLDMQSEDVFQQIISDCGDTELARLHKIKDTLEQYAFEIGVRRRQLTGE